MMRIHSTCFIFTVALLLTPTLYAADGEPLQVHLDDQHRLVVDGKVVFPLGLYLGPTEDEHLARIAEAGFNTILCYGFGRNMDTEQITAYMDRAHKHGLWVIYSLKDHYKHHRGFPADKYANGPQLAKEVHIPLLKDHPALLAWYINDEIYPSKTRIQQAQSMYDTVKQADPNHPVLAVINRPYEAHQYKANTDIIAPDPYPVPDYPLTKVNDWLRLTKEGVDDERALWCVPQIFAWGIYQVRESPEKVYGREPTFTEMRCMAYLSLIEQVKGLLFYSYMDLWRRPGRQNENEELFNRRWAQIVPMARELKTLTDVLLHAEDIDLTIRPFWGNVKRRVVSHNDKLYILVANTSYDNKAQKLWIDLPEGDWNVECVLRGDALTDFDEQGRLVVYLGPTACDTIILARQSQDTPEDS